jgi:HD-GYP domain-containing protein (c-di-GMP phosphodiesterase class II)
VRVSAIAWDELGDLTEGFNALSQALEVERQRNQDLYRDTVQALSAAIDARDPYTRGHSQRVGAYARLIARKLGWTPQQAYQLYITGLLHDIGKIGVPEQVLNKAGKLDPDERELVESHTLIGYNIARQARALEPHLSGIRHHHERMDGKGYPDGLSGEAIGAEARILAVADVWDALTSPRPYRRALSPQEAYRLLQLESLDPRAVRALWELWQEGALEELLEDARQKNPTLGKLSAPPPRPGSAPARPDEDAPGFQGS